MLHRYRPIASPYSAIILCSAIGLAATLRDSSAIVIYDELATGDLSNDGLVPTTLPISAGVNEVRGSTGRVGAVDRDYFTFTIPSGHELVAIVVLPDTTTEG